MNKLLKWGSADWDLAYIFARGYYDGRMTGGTDMDKDWMTAAELEAFNWGYDRGVSDYHNYDEGIKA